VKQLDNSNERERQRALKGDPPQPYYQQFIDYRKACPFCGEPLRQRHNARWGEMDNECRCSFWSFEMYPTSFWKRTPKSPDHAQILT
jgi:hypothetical protein